MTDLTLRSGLVTPSHPILVITIDTEEEFNWGKPFSRSNIGTGSIGSQHLAHQVYDKYGVRPTYLVGYPVANNERAAEILRELQGAGKCEIGAHLHPWVTPPFDEDVTDRNSYQCYLPPALEREKMRRLVDKIEEAFGSKPQVFRAGRYGAGPETFRILNDLGFLVDTSVVPHTSFADLSGPTFEGFPDRPYWIEQPGGVLELPLSCGFSGYAASLGPLIYPSITSSIGRTFKMGAIFSRLGLLERCRLTPEGFTAADLKRLTTALIGQGHAVFSMSYHSPTLAPGNTVYVKNQQDLQQFLGTIDDFLEFFHSSLNGRAVTAIEARRLIVGEEGSL